MARRQPGCRVERDRPRRALRRRGPDREVADARAGRLRGAGRGRRSRLRARLPGDARQPHHGRPRAPAGSRRGDRRRALDRGVARRLPQPAVQVRHGPAGDAARRRRPGLHPRGGGDAVVLRHGDGRPRLARRHGGRLRRDGARLRRLAVAAGRGRPPHRAARRRAGCQGRRLRQGHRGRGVAGTGVELGARLLVADRHHLGRRAAAHRLARVRRLVARSGDRRGLLGAALRGRRRASRSPRRSAAAAISRSASSSTAR